MSVCVEYRLEGAQLAQTLPQLFCFHVKFYLFVICAFACDVYRSMHNNYSMVRKVYISETSLCARRPWRPDRALNWITFKCYSYGETGSWIGMLSLNRISCLWDYHSTSLRHPFPSELFPQFVWIPSAFCHVGHLLLSDMCRDWAP